MSNPILPVYLVTTYYYQYQNTLVGLNSLLDSNVLNQTCSTSFDCRHDFIIRINQVSAGATASASSSFQSSRIALGNL